MAAGDNAVAVSGEGAPMRRARELGRQVLQQERRRARIAIAFIGKSQMRRLNHEHLGHDYATDVISFALPQPDGTLAADIYICRYVAARNARANAVPLREELLRLVVHGTLHILGWDHPDGPGRTTSPMWRRQERYLARFAWAS